MSDQLAYFYYELMCLVVEQFKFIVENESKSSNIISNKLCCSFAMESSVVY